MNLGKTIFFGHFIGQPFFADELFCDLSPQTNQSLQVIKRSKKIRENNTVLAAGDLPPCIYILRTGCARMIFQNALNRSKSSRLVEKNEVVGLNEVMANSFCEMSVKTITPCTFECLLRKEFMNFLDQEPEICFRLVKTLGANLQKSYQNFSSATF